MWLETDEWIFLIWREAELLVLKNLLQKEHLYGRSPVWVRRCCVKLPFCVKAFSHTEHRNGLSPVWTLMWFAKLDLFWKDLWHKEHLYGCSPVWVRRWSVKWPFCLKALSHTEHANGLSPVWTLMCSVKLDLPLKDLPHSRHWWEGLTLSGRAAMWTNQCYFYLKITCTTKYSIHQMTRVVLRMTIRYFFKWIG